MLQSINRKLEKWMPAITPLSVIIGVLLTQRLISYTYLVPWIFAVLTFFGSLNLNFKDLHRVLINPIPVGVALLILHVIMPLLGWGAGKLFFGDDILMTTGLIVLMATPTGVFSLMWVTIYKGNIALALSIILLSTLLSPFLIPYCLSLLVGAEVAIETLPMMKGLLFMIVVPSLIGLFINHISQGKVKEKWSPSLAPFSKIGLSLVIMINSSAIAPLLLNFDLTLLYTAFIIVILVCIGYLLGWFTAKTFKFNHDTRIALTFNSGMRNVSAGAVIALAYFPPEVVFPVIVGILFQQTLASLFGHLFFGIPGRATAND
jgi:BASS family bile acid:Na+ symporter